ncbi:DUF1361 domain-containing protein [Erysipelothrix anatis]|uniref:DUF1361 domain-containing protein n=1 Tax=Erysipelothrix anatis TaxID=2683713 RepID=UPI001F351C79|nr:DUF1361 domain-containing protein [Erysipelothrix anatis]
MGISGLFLSAILLNLFAYITIKLRPRIYGVSLFKPMIWNFKLSLLPFAILVVDIVVFFLGAVVSSYSGIEIIRYAGMFTAVMGLFVWLLALPNSGYLITELNLTHRDVDGDKVPIWYDIISVMAFAMSGIVNTLVNIVMIQLMILIFNDPNTVTKTHQSIFILTALILNLLVAIGVYLGRSIRFNSWDVIHIKSFLTKLSDHFKQHGEWKNCILFVAFHTIFFMIMYVLAGIPFFFN